MGGGDLSALKTQVAELQKSYNMMKQEAVKAALAAFDQAQKTIAPFASRLKDALAGKTVEFSPSEQATLSAAARETNALLTTQPFLSPENAAALKGKLGTAQALQKIVAQQKSTAIPPEGCTPELIADGKALHDPNYGDLDTACIFAVKRSKLNDRHNLKAVQCYLWDEFGIDLQKDLTWKGGSKYQLHEMNDGYFAIRTKTELERPNNGRVVERTVIECYGFEVTDVLEKIQYNNAQKDFIVGFTATRTIKRFTFKTAGQGEPLPAPMISYPQVYAQAPNNNVLNTGDRPTLLSDGKSTSSLPANAANALRDGVALPTDLLSLEALFRSEQPKNGEIKGIITWTVVPPIICYNYQITDGAFTYNASAREYTATRTVTRSTASIAPANGVCPPSVVNYQNIYAAGGDLKPNQQPPLLSAPTGTGSTLPPKAKLGSSFSIAQIENSFANITGNSYTAELKWKEKEPEPALDPIPITFGVYADNRNAPQIRGDSNTEQIQGIVKWLADNPDYGIHFRFTVTSTRYREEIAAQAKAGATLDDVVVGSSKGVTYRMRGEARINLTRSDIIAEANKQGVPTAGRLKFAILPVSENNDESTATPFYSKK